MGVGTVAYLGKERPKFLENRAHPAKWLIAARAHKQSPGGRCAIFSAKIPGRCARFSAQKCARTNVPLQLGWSVAAPLELRSQGESRMRLRRSHLRSIFADRKRGGSRNRTDAWGFCRARPYHLAIPPFPRVAERGPRWKGHQYTSTGGVTMVVSLPLRIDPSDWSSESTMPFLNVTVSWPDGVLM